MNKEEIILIKCALADLQGAMEAMEKADYCSHDWEAHQQTIDEIEEYLEINTD